MKKTIYKAGECKLIMNLDKHGVWFCVQTPNMSSGIYPRRPIKLLLEALNHKSKKLIEAENELENTRRRNEIAAICSGRRKRQ